MIPPCECPQPGYCERHKMNKTAHLFNLCQNRADYRELWDGRASGDKMAVAWKTKLKSAMTALSNFVVSGGVTMMDDDKQARLAVCNEPCAFLGSALGQKTCTACGCFVEIKASFPLEHCPKSKWPGDPPVVDKKGCCGG